ncbi:hypothetical protein D9M68_71130 [compost metagenome]
MNLEKYQAVVFDLETVVDQDTGILAALLPAFTTPADDLLGQFYAELKRLDGTFNSSSFVRLHALAYLNLAVARKVKVRTPDSLVFSRSAAHWPLFTSARPVFQALGKACAVVILTRQDSPPQHLLMEQIRLLSTQAIPTAGLGEWLNARSIRPAQALHVTLKSKATKPRLDKCLVRHEMNRRHWNGMVTIGCLSELVPDVADAELRR